VVLGVDAVGDAAVGAGRRSGGDPAERRLRGVVVPRGRDDDLLAAAADRQRGGADALADPRLDVASELHAAAVEELGDGGLRVGGPDDLRERRLGVGLLLAVAGEDRLRVERGRGRDGRRRVGPAARAR
jgi:hypothetical protein